ncbi:MAG: DMT family transporter [Chloroflexi bacterium]|nr:DMT family transporter [Chloroflexota bacterium]
MLSLSIFYGILSALVWGAGDFAGGLATRKLGAYRAVFYADLIGLLALIAVVIFFPEPLPPLSSLLIAGLGGMLGSVGLITLYYSMAKGQMSIAAPVSALFAAALPVLVSAFTEGLPTLVQFIGFGLALSAVWLISQGDASHRLHLERLSDLRLPLLAGLGFGSYFILIHYATDGITSTFYPMIASRTAGTIMLFGFVLALRQGFGVPREAWGVVFANGMLDVGGNFFYLLALRTGRLDISAILSSLYPGATVILAWVFLKEKISRSQWMGILLALAAIALFSS